MPDAKHTPTPGPWVADEDEVRTDPGDMLIATVWGCSAAEANANAALIAAAPDFLAACTGERDGIPALDWLAALLTEVDAHFKELAGDDPQALYAALGVSSRLLRELRAAVAKAEERDDE